MRLRVDEIRIGKRHRQEMGDLDGLAESIERFGLLHPIVVTPAGTLIAGDRRLRAVKKLGRKTIDATVVDIDKIAHGEYAENIDRKDFTWAEAVAILKEVRPLEAAAAKQRQRESPGRGKKGGQIAQPFKGRAADKAARATGRKRRTLEKAERVVDAAERDPQRYGDLAERLKQDDVSVDAIHRELKQRAQRAAYEVRAERGGVESDLKALAAAGRRFKVIYADPPWEFKVYSGRGKARSADRHYDTLSLAAIKALPVAHLAADDCALFLWGVWPELAGALEVIAAWGFEYKTLAFVWLKTAATADTIKLDGDGLHWGMGYWTRANTEFCLLATRGAPLRLAQDVHQVVIAPVGAHSTKPEQVRNRIEGLLAGPYLEIFARRRTAGWTVWGNELLQQAAE